MRLLPPAVRTDLRERRAINQSAGRFSGQVFQVSQVLQASEVIVLGGLTRNLSLISGLVLFLFAATHFLNHAVGLFNLEAMDQVQGWRLAVTRSWPGVIILAAALVIHIVFGLLKLLGRRTLRLPAWELTQLILGLAIPFLLLPHVIDTHVAHSLFDVQDSYLYELA